MFFYFDKNPFIAIIGDIRDSRSLSLRNGVQEKLKIVLDGINNKYEQEIASKFVTTLGDEFQGLLSDGTSVLKIIEEIRMQLYPVDMRFGIGIGKITTDINTEMALGADGPGYYKAREAVEKIKENEKKKKAVVSDIRLEQEMGNEQQIVLINTVFELLKSIEQKWTERQREIIWNMLKYQDGQEKVACRMGITQSSVHKSLVSGQYYAYEKAMKNVQDILGEIRV